MASIEDLEQWIAGRDRDHWYVAAQGSEAPSVEEIDVFEAELGFSLPAAVREFAGHDLGGIFIEAQEGVWPPAEALAVGPFWSFLNGLQVYSLAVDAPEWLSMGQARAQMLADAADVADLDNRDVVPVLKVLGDPEPYCATSEGDLIRLGSYGTERIPFTGDFYDLLMAEITELEDRLRRKMAGEDRN